MYVNEMNIKYVQHELVWMSLLYKLCKTIVYMSKPIHEVTQKVLAYSASDNETLCGPCKAAFIMLKYKFEGFKVPNLFC